MTNLNVLNIVIDNKGIQFSPDSLPSTFTRDGSGNVTMETKYDGQVYRDMTFTRDGSGNVTAISQWVQR